MTPYEPTTARYGLTAADKEWLRSLYAWDARLRAWAEIRDLRRELDELQRKYDDHDKGLDRWCDWQDRTMTVIGEMGVAPEFDRRLGRENLPLCRHERELDELRSAARTVVDEITSPLFDGYTGDELKDIAKPLAALLRVEDTNTKDTT